MCHGRIKEQMEVGVKKETQSIKITPQVGSMERDKELGFRISQETTISYFGSAVLPEKLEEIYGEVTDELIENNNIIGIVDNYFCESCEKKFSVFENEYAKTLNKPTSINQNYISEKTPFLGFLFWFSIIWRLSIHNRSGFKLKPQEEKKIGRILNKYLVINIKELEIDKNDVDLTDIGYKILRAANFSNENSTWLHLSPFHGKPYSLIVDEFFIFIYFKKNHLKGMIHEFYGTNSFKQKAIFNTAFTQENIFGISHKDYEIISTNVAESLAKKRFDNLNWKLDMIHQKLGGKGKEMYPKYKNEIIKRIANNKEALAKRGTTEEYIKIIVDTIRYFKNT